MAAVSLKASSISGISSILRNRTAQKKVEQRVRFQVPQNVTEVLLDFTTGKNIRAYEELVCTIKDGTYITDNELLRVLRVLRECISQLDIRISRFVEALLRINWTHRSEEVAKEFQGFILDLLSAHTYYIKPTLENLMTILKSGEENSEWTTGVPTETESIRFAYVHAVIKALIHIVPMSCDLLAKTVANCFPYFKRSTHEQECYIYNMLRITSYQPHLLQEFLFIIFKRLITMDVYAPRTEILDREEEDEDDDDDMDIDDAETFKMDTIDENNDPSEVHFKMKHPVGNCLDAAMKQIFLYMQSECYDSDNTIHWERTKKLYHNLITVFDQIILTTHATNHVQFVMFYLCSLKPALAEGFIRFLWRKVENPNVAIIVRQSAVMYIGSFLSRAKYVNMSLLKTFLTEMSSWIHKYITNQDGLEYVNTDVRIHAVFYAACQALFYVIAFRHKDFIGSKKGLAFLQSLNLSKMVTCKLNPLKVCLPVVVQNFAAITRMYQLVYCYSVLEHNSRQTIPVISRDNKLNLFTTDSSWLEFFFPFDPFILKRCSQYIKPIYAVYQKSDTEEPAAEHVGVEKLKGMEEEDDFLSDSSQPNKSSLAEIFSYSSSPGFKRL